MCDTANLLTPVGTAAFDLLVLVLTVYKTAALVKRSREAELTKTLTYVLLRDGMCNFIGDLEVYLTLRLKGLYIMRTFLFQG